ncbi:hypothetical protein CC78DRAFT_193491 [Lojkania enalia]|uniref:Uncharacterized protein n=1 Tax=Lojkania enalia TaxID=147567 RepID=A0A9P4NBE0_9PLEO|nr:hypothetical protein CC78DRAFT_193491 [Didymosphaeria enalia]
MKRKFSFNLAPVKVGASKVDARAAPEPTPSHTHTHRRGFSKDSISSLDSPFINRRPLSPTTEQELRAACALILKNFKPSDYELKEKERSIHNHASNKRLPDEIRVHRPTGAPAESRSAHARDAGKQGPRADVMKTYPDLPTQANTARRRIDHAEDSQEVGKPVKSPSSDLPRSVTVRNDLDSDDGLSVRTPLTGSTDGHLHNGSTAPTSAALASSRSSKRGSNQPENAAAVADAEAAEWMRQELEKRRQQAFNPQPDYFQRDHKAPARPPTRTRSIKEYIFPGSRTLSRRESHESIRSQISQNEPKRSGSSQGWRSWGLQRRSSSRSSSRPGTSKGRVDSHDPEAKPEINLNRELPPLPSLDSWNQQEQDQRKKEHRKSQTQGAHIASLMRPQDRQEQEYAAAVRRHHRRSGSDTLAIRYANSFSQSTPQIARTASQMKGQPRVVQQKRSQRLETASDFDQLMSAMDSSSRDLDQQLKLRVNDQAHPPRTSSLSRSPSMKMSMDQSRHLAPNFSRKISSDVSPQRGYEPYPNTVQIRSQPYGTHKDEKQSKLKRVLSGWGLRKEKKGGNWMDQLERNGVRTGVMVQDEAALPPVVRY